MKLLCCWLNLVIFLAFSTADNYQNDSKWMFLKDFTTKYGHLKINFYGCLKQVTKFRYIRSVENLKTSHAELLIADGSNCNLTSYLHKLDEYNMFLIPMKHLILTSDENSMVNLFAKLKIPLTGEIILAIFSDESVTLKFLYKIGRNNYLVKEQLGTWTPQSGLHLWPANAPLRRTNFQKQPINLGVVIFHEMKVLQSNLDDIPETTEIFFQQDMPLIYTLIQNLNATMNMIVYDKYGYEVVNKSTGEIVINGMVRDVYDGKLDISESVYWSPARRSRLQALAPIDFWEIIFFLRKPSLSYITNIYFLTLSRWVWTVTFAITILIITTIYITFKWEKTVIPKRKSVTGSDMILLSFEALCQQGTSLEPMRIPGRFLLFLFFLMVMFLYVAYSAGILVLLKSTAKINNLNELLESRYEVGGWNENFIKEYFTSPKQGVLRKLYVKKIHANSYFTVADGLEKVRKGNFAFFTSTTLAYKYFSKNYTNYEICCLQELPGYLNMKLYPTVPKNSGYAEIFKIGLLKIKEIGLNTRAKHRVVTKPQCNNQSGIFQSVRIYDCLFVIVLFIVGTSLSVAILILEIYCNKWRGSLYLKYLKC
ncbi:hypothetical protein ABEB36_008153 [Hypothenemus hampei]|uniref:Ionotropic glutamate receptor C-terminal domain-containing protein n=1 Tax=Hypothenemus hampei TaxID=57062 RepID=A0ABD1EKW9_HYPHA